MIAVDTSALMAIVGAEPAAEAALTAIAEDRRLVISAATLTEALIVADRRNVGDVMRTLVAKLAPALQEVDAATAARVADIYSRWGKGVHPVSLNLVDCFAYDVARQNDCPLLYVGADFSRTDISSAL